MAGTNVLCFGQRAENAFYCLIKMIYQAASKSVSTRARQIGHEK